MKNKRTLWTFITLFFGIITSFVTMPVVSAKGEFRVGMEAAYAPFNWTQNKPDEHAAAIDGEPNFAGGYDVQIAQKIADALGKKLVIVKSSWDGLVPALNARKIDAIIGGMSPTPERKKEIDFSHSYYTSNLIMVVRADSPYAKATSLNDFKGAKITGQLNTFHYSVIDQIPDVKRQEAMDDFTNMRAALAAGIIDGYVAERPEGVTVEAKDKTYKMVQFANGQGFKTNPEDTQIAVGLRKGDPDLAKINEVIDSITPEEQKKMMDDAIAHQPGQEKKAEGTQKSAPKEATLVSILKDNWKMFARGTGFTIFISMVGTIAGLIIGLLIGIYRTAPVAEKGPRRYLHVFFEKLLVIYIEIFRGTPMMVQSMVIYYGLAQFLGIDLNRIVAALIIVSINTGAYMSEIVRGGIFAVDKGQFEAAEAIGMTHRQTMFKVVMPQVIRNILPVTGNEFVINIKDTSVLSVISVSELFFQGRTIAGQSLKIYQTYFIISVIYLFLTFTITRILRMIERKMDGHSNYIPYANQDQVTNLEK